MDELSPEEYERALNELRGRKFDCDVCGVTVDGEWLELHSAWHDDQIRINAVVIQLISELRQHGQGRQAK